jgi:hypothetical protein
MAKTRRRVLTGRKAIEAALRRVATDMKRNLTPAITDVTAFVQHESMDRTPLRTGNLRGSTRSIVRKYTGKVVGTVYLTAAYALFVHEAAEKVKFRSPWPRGRKYLERAMSENVGAIRAMIRRWLV